MVVAVREATYKALSAFGPPLPLTPISSMSYEQDLEKSVTLKDVTNDVSRVEERSGGTSREATLKEDDLIEMRGPAFRFFGKLFSMGVEARGIERIPEEERSEEHSRGLLLLWFSVNLVVTTVPIGMLAQAYYTLTLKNTVAAIMTFNIIGCACTAFIATLGPKTGLRTMVITRYSVGFVGGSIFAVLNILTQLGFSVTAVILGGQTLTNVSDGKLPLAAAVVLVGIVSLILCFFGYNVLHHYERYAWLVILVIYIMAYAKGGAAGYQPELQAPKEATGKTFAAGFLSFGGIIFSSATGWAPVAADFNCRLPTNYSSRKVFLLTFFGLMLPLVFVETLGAALMTVPKYAAAFEDGDAGGLIAEVFSSWGGGGKFILILLAFSVIGNNIPNTYSAALSIQTLHPILQKIPRALLTILVFIIYTVAGVVGREHFSGILSNFLAILGYWTAFFIVIIAEEHLIFRKYFIPGGYDLSVYDSIRDLPVGLAGIFAGFCGAGAAVVGMAEEWYTGPLGRAFGDTGGDLGFEMAAVAAGIVYPPLRYLELRYFKR